jgi:hypothetical protein
MRLRVRIFDCYNAHTFSGCKIEEYVLSIQDDRTPVKTTMKIVREAKLDVEYSREDYEAMLTTANELRNAPGYKYNSIFIMFNFRVGGGSGRRHVCYPRLWLAINLVELLLSLLSYSFCNIYSI